MSSKRLVARSRLNPDASPASRSHQRHSEVGNSQSTVLPPYQPPSCALTPSSKRALEEISLNHDYSKYKKHLQLSVQLLTYAAVSINDRLSARQELARKQEEKRKQAGLENEAKTEDEIEAEQYTQTLDKRVSDVTAKVEKALRDIIDYGDELAMQSNLLQKVGERIESAPAPRRREYDEEEDGDEDAPAANVDILSPVELFKQASEEYHAEYRAKSMRSRYDVNDYRNFKRTVHDAQHPDSDAAPVPHASTWFPEDNNPNTTPGSRRRRNNTTDNTNNEDDDDDDDDVVIQRATTSLKDIFTLQYFKEPFTSNVCRHTFEKAEFLKYHDSEGVVFAPSSQRGARARPTGPKKVTCPQSGCEAMLEPSDFYVDQLIKRQVERAQRQEAMGDEDEDEDEYDATQGSRRGQAASQDDGIDIDDEDEDVVSRRKQRGATKRDPSSSDPIDNPAKAMDEDSD